MNSSPRWFWIASGVLVFNVVVVVSTVFWRHLAADEPAVARDVAGNDASNSPIKPELPIPDTLPEVPSLSDPDSLKDDPGFQEFRRMFDQEVESWDSELPGSQMDSVPGAQLDSARPRTSQREAYFNALDRRLETVEQLCAVARRVAAEAAQQAKSGSSGHSHELLQMATQLREMAAKLLVTEL